MVETFFFYSVVGDAVSFHVEEKDIPIDFKDLPLDPTVSHVPYHYAFLFNTN